MKLYTNTSLYRECLQMIDLIDQLLKNHQRSTVLWQFDHELVKLSTSLALALEEREIEQLDFKLFTLDSQITKLIQLANLAYHRHEIDLNENEQLEKLLNSFLQRIQTFPQRRKNILILSSIMGQGHMSASKAIKEGLEFLYGKDYHVSIIDFYEQVGPLFNKATVRAYEGSTKHLPAAYKYFFEGTDAKWPVQLLNLVNYPLNAAKLEKMFKSYNPHLVISAYPIWDLLATMIIKKCGPIKMFSIVTDSISIHNAWVTGKPDAHLVANVETAISMKKLGVKEDKIKVLGFPVKLAFNTPGDRDGLLKNFGLDSSRYTILLLTTAQKTTATNKIINEIHKNFPEINFLIVCGRNKDLYPKLEHFNHLPNTRVIGWTDQMPEIIKASDLVITKAGGATVMECIAAKKPMIITQVIPGQEMGNAVLIKLHELGIIQKEAKMSISECIDYIRKNQQRILNNLARVSKPEASTEIARFIHEQIG